MRVRCLQSWGVQRVHQPVRKQHQGRQEQGHRHSVVQWITADWTAQLLPHHTQSVQTHRGFPDRYKSAIYIHICSPDCFVHIGLFQTRSNMQNPDRLRPHIDSFIDSTYYSDACLLHTPSQIALAAVLHAASREQENLDSYVTDLLFVSAREKLPGLIDAVRSKFVLWDGAPSPTCLFPDRNSHNGEAISAARSGEGQGHREKVGQVPKSSQ